LMVVKQDLGHRMGIVSYEGYPRSNREELEV